LIKQGDIGFVITKGGIPFALDPTSSPKNSRNKKQSVEPEEGEELNDDESTSLLQPRPSKRSRGSFKFPNNQFTSLNPSISTQIPKPSADAFYEYNNKAVNDNQTSDQSNEPFNLELSKGIRIVKEVKLTNHIIVCGFSSSLDHFIAPLRLNALKKHPPIVIVYHEIPSEEEAWESLAIFPDIYFIKGEASRFSLLIKAGILTCSRVVVIANDSVRQKNPDALGITIGKNIQLEAKDMFEIIEIAHESNIEFLSPSAENWRYRVEKTRQKLNDPGISHHKRMKLIDYLRNSYKADFLTRDEIALKRGDPGLNISASSLKTTEQLLINPFPNYHFESVYAAGNVFSSSFLDTLLCHEFFRPYSTDIVNSFVGRVPNQSQLFQIPVPPHLVGENYLEAMQYLLPKGMLPVGLYRGKSDDRKNTSPYVYTNCARTTVLEVNDLIFILALSEPI